MSDKIKIGLGAGMFVLFLIAGIFGLIADSARKEDTIIAKKQLDDALQKSIAEQTKNTAQMKKEHEGITHFIFAAVKQNQQLHDATHKKLDEIKTGVNRLSKSVLKKAAEENLDAINNRPADSEEFRRALHSARDWARDYRLVTGKAIDAPRAQAGGKAVADFYTARLGEITE